MNIWDGYRWMRWKSVDNWWQWSWRTSWKKQRKVFKLKWPSTKKLKKKILKVYHSFCSRWDKKVLSFSEPKLYTNLFFSASLARHSLVFYYFQRKWKIFFFFLNLNLNFSEISKNFSLLFFKRPIHIFNACILLYVCEKYLYRVEKNGDNFKITFEFVCKRDTKTKILFLVWTLPQRNNLKTLPMLFYEIFSRGLKK